MAEYDHSGPKLFVTNHRVTGFESMLIHTASMGIVADEHYWIYRITAQALRAQPNLCQTP